ncbi:ABC transporter substrate-binding protein [Caenimonas sedimenti]|nr:ABC transporter substrate-binding protein [Caenimonas sedimenti]
MPALAGLTRRRLVLWAAAASPVAFAQRPDVARRVCFLFSSASGRNMLPAQLLREGLAEKGWVEGRNLVLDVRVTDVRNPAGTAIAARELLAAPCDLMVTSTDQQAAEVARYSGSVPVVFAYGLDPVGLGVVRSLARPGGNITGYSAMDREIAAKRIQILKELIPRLNRLVVLHPVADDGARASAAGLAAIAQSLSIAATPTPYTAANLGLVYADMSRTGIQATLSVPSQLAFAVRRELAALAIQHRIPGIFGSPEFADTGALVSYGVSLNAAFRRAGTLADKILRGASPSNVPVEQINVYEFVLNMKTATDMGLRIPNHVMLQATRVVG